MSLFTGKNVVRYAALIGILTALALGWYFFRPNSTRSDLTDYIVLEVSTLPEPTKTDYPDCFIVFKMTPAEGGDPILIRLKGFEGRELMKASVYKEGDRVALGQLRELSKDEARVAVSNDVLDLLPEFTSDYCELVHAAPVESLDSITSELFRGRLPQIQAVHPEKRQAVVRAYFEHRISLEDKPVNILIGDSEAMGYGNPNDSTYAAMLEQSIGTTINLSFPSASPEDYIWLAEMISASDFKFDRVLYAFNVRAFNDIPDAPQVVVREPQLEVTENDLRNLWTIERNQVFSDSTISPERFPGYKGSTKFSCSGINVSRLRQFCEKIKKIGKRPIAFAVPYCKELLVASEIDQQFNDGIHLHLPVFFEAGIPFVDFTEAVPASGFRDLVHLNEAGHREFAVKLADLLNSESTESAQSE
ncbi:MAG: hypothetical protein ACI8UO_000991 [Verrucomicrobiales bacterium]|jgi:hypothetical protein